MNNDSYLFHEETYEGFDICVYALSEDLPLEDIMDYDTIDEIRDLYRKISQGAIVYFCAKVTASKCGIELSSDYLGACLYDSYEAFIDIDGYFGDMRHNVVVEAKKAIKELCRGVTNE